MKTIKASFIIVGICLMLTSGIAQNGGTYYWPGYHWPSWVFDTPEYKAWSERWQEEYRKWVIGYIQDWHENMQKGILRLNTEPQGNGVTPINGALLLDVTDIAKPGRLGNYVEATRRYNGKIWHGDSNEIAAGGKDHVKAFSWVGMGWDLHFGRYYAEQGDNTKRIFETPSGNRVYFKESNGKYLATDGSFDILKNDTLRTSLGDILVFTSNPTLTLTYIKDMYDITHTSVYSLTKCIDRNGNITSLFYRSTPLWMGEKLYYPLDSVISSTNEKIVFHYDTLTVLPAGYRYVRLDSISYLGFNGNTLKVRYRYVYDSTATSPFGNDFSSELDEDIYWNNRPTYLLRSVLFPNGDSVYYDYNQYYELTDANTTGAGLTKYTHETYSYWIPRDPVFPPGPGGADTACRQYTRATRYVIADDPWSAPDTTEYLRIFCPPTGYPTANHGQTNADTVKIKYPEGNYEVFDYLHSGLKASGDFSFYWYNGRLDNTIYAHRIYDKNDVLLMKRKSSHKYVTADSIMVVDYVKWNNGLVTYERKYDNYDAYGHAQLICDYGDTSITTDDRWIHRRYAYTDTTFWLKTTAGPGNPPDLSYTSFYSIMGVDTLIVKRSWSNSETGPWDVSVTDTFVYSPSYGKTQTLTIDTTSHTYARVDAWAKECGTTDSLYVWAVWALLLPPDFDLGFPFAYKQRYVAKNLVHLPKLEFVAPAPVVIDTLSRVKYFYDDTMSIVTHYLPPIQWDTIPINPHKLRGNLTRIERLRYGSTSTKEEFRYDDVGNIVMSITHPETGRAETTFTYYTPPDPIPETYHYAFPTRVVNHLATQVCSLYTKYVYDQYTGLVGQIFDPANGDSTVYTYDNMNRLTSVILPDETLPSKIIKYRDDYSPEAVIDSVKQNTGVWMSSASYYDGFKRLIQTKKFNSDDNKTTIQNISYNNNGMPELVSNHYFVNGTSTNYTTPDWGKPYTSYQHDGLNRITKIKYPDAESILVSYNGNIDTLTDGKGLKTVHIRNSYGSIDSIIDALNNTTSYAYDRLGWLTHVNDAESHQSKYYYDKIGNLIAMNGPDAKSSYTQYGDSVDVVYEYDNVGNVTRKKDAGGWTDYAYDDIYRLVRVNYSTDQGSEWAMVDTLTYDVYYTLTGYPNNAKGRLSRIVTVGVDSLTFYYDNQGRLDRKRTGIVGLLGIKEVNYDYDKADLCTLLTLQPGAYSVRYKYNKLGQTQEIQNLVGSFKYNPAGQITKMNYPDYVQDTIAYDNRLRPTYIRAYRSRRPSANYLKLAYTYEKNSNVASIVDSLDNTNTLSFRYDALNQLDSVLAYDNSVAQRFTYDKVGNRISKDGATYTYWTNTNRLKTDHRGYTFDYDDHGNIVRHRSTETGTTIDSFSYNWDGRLVQYNKGNVRIDFAYNASGLRVKKYYRKVEEGKDGGELGSYFIDPPDDMGTMSTAADSLYNKGRDIEKIFVKNNTRYLTITIPNRHMLSRDSHLRLIITLDIDTIPNSGRLALPEDSLTKVMPECAWEYCIYVDDNGYGLYMPDGSKISTPFGMLVQRTTGDMGQIKVEISKSLINSAEVIRFTISTFDPSVGSNPDILWQGGSTACDVFPGTNATFGGEINGYVQITPSIRGAVEDYTIYYVYDGINPIAEYSPNGSLLAQYVYEGGLHVARIAGADTNWYHCDALGSPRKMTNESGSVTWSATYYPFGEMTAVGTNTHGFTGKEYDIEMGLNYFCQRYYDPEIGRFFTLDKWTNLPDDQRIVSYTKYLLWSNSALKYEPVENRNINECRQHAHPSDTIHYSSIHVSPRTTCTLGQTYSTIRTETKCSYLGHYRSIRTPRYSTGHLQVCGYLYCRNNPLLYCDPTGYLFDWTARDWYCNVGGTVIGGAVGTIAGLATANPLIGLGVGSACSIFGAGLLGEYWDWCMDLRDADRYGSGVSGGAH